MAAKLNLWFDYYNTMSNSEYWTNFVNGPGTETNFGVAADGNRNVIVCGGTSGAGTANVHHVNSSIYGAIRPFSGYVVKYDPFGTPQFSNFISNTLTPASFPVTCNTVAVDTVGNIYVGGGTVGFANIFNSDGTGTNPASNIGRNAGYIVKYNGLTGNPEWRVFVANTSTSITQVRDTSTPPLCINSVSVDPVFDGSGYCNVYGVGSTGSLVTGASVQAPSNIFQSTSNYIPGGVSTVGPVGSFFPSTAAGNSVSYVTQFRSDGRFNWAGYVSSNSFGTSSAVDSEGCVYMAGYTTGLGATGTANPSSIFSKNNTTPAASGVLTPGAIFLIKFNSVGDPLWYSKIDDGTTAAIENPCGIAVDRVDDSVYIVGSTAPSVTTAQVFNSNVYGLTAAPQLLFSGLSSGSAFIVKYSSSGLAQWRAYIDGTGFIDTSRAVTVDSLQNVIIVGSTGNAPASIVSSNIVPTSTVSTNIPANSGFMVKFSKNGVLLNRNYIQPTTTTTVVGSNNFAVTSDQLYNNIILVGGTPSVNSLIHNSNVDSNCFTGISIPNSSGYVVKYNSDGNFPTVSSLVSNGWITFLSNVTTTASTGFVTTIDNGFYITGSTNASSNPASFYNVGGTYSGADVPSGCSFIAKYDTNGNYIWNSYIYGSGTSVLGVHGSNTDGIYIVGSAGSTTATLFSSIGKVVRTFQASSSFIIRYDINGNILSSASVSNATVYSCFNAYSNVYIAGTNSTVNTSNIINSVNSVVGGAIGPTTSFVFPLDNTLTTTKWGSANCYTYFRGSAGTQTTFNYNVTVSPASDGTVYVAGATGGTATNIIYGDTTPFTGTTIPSTNINSGYITALDINGKFKWKSFVDAAASTESGNFVLADTQSNVYLVGSTGSVTGSLIYNNSNVQYTNSLGLPANAGFLNKYYQDGTLLWTANIAGGTAATSNCIAIDSNNDVYIGGRCTATSLISHSNVFYGVNSGLTFTGTTDPAFIAKYNGVAGNALWRTYVDQPNAAVDTTRSLSLDSSGYIYSAINIGAAGAYISNNAANAFSSAFQNPSVLTTTGGMVLVKYKPNGMTFF